MASFNYMNNTAPFWDYLANLEQQGNNHPFFGRNQQDHDHKNEHGDGLQGLQPPAFDPFGRAHQLFGGPEGLPHRRGPPAGPHGPIPSHHDEQSPRPEHDGVRDGEKGENDHEHGNNQNDNGEGPANSGSDGEGGRRCGRGRHGRCGSRRERHGFKGRGGFGPYHGGPGPHGHRGHHGHWGFPFGSPPHHEGSHDSPRGHGPRGHHRPGRPGGQEAWGCSGPFGSWCQMRGAGVGAGCNPASVFSPFFSDFLAGNYPNKNEAGANDNEDFTPEADVFDTPSSFFIHISLPGAKKEDVGVNWDAEKLELSVAGVIYRAGDEDFLKTLAMDERKVGPFERKIRLGTRANPARVDADSITAKLEDGVLRIEVRKEEEGFIEIKKVDVE